MVGDIAVAGGANVSALIEPVCLPDRERGEAREKKQEPGLSLSIPFTALQPLFWRMTGILSDREPTMQ